MVQVVSKWVFMLIALLSRDAVCVLECLVLCLCALVFTYLWRYIKYDALFCTGSRRSMHFSWLLILQHESVQISVVFSGTSWVPCLRPVNRFQVWLGTPIAP